MRIAENPADDGAANLDGALLIEERRLRVVRRSWPSAATMSTASKAIDDRCNILCIYLARLTATAACSATPAMR